MNKIIFGMFLLFSCSDSSYYTVNDCINSPSCIDYGQRSCVKDLRCKDFCEYVKKRTADYCACICTAEHPDGPYADCMGACERDAHH